MIDRDGLSALSMRTVAAELDRRPMALYRYVDDRDELECLVVDLVLGPGLEQPLGEGTPRQRISGLMHRIRLAVAAHPGVVPLVVRHRHSCLPALRWSEQVLAELVRAGVGAEDRAVASEGPERPEGFEGSDVRAGADALMALRTLIAYLVGALELEHETVIHGAERGLPAAALPADGFPLLSAAALTPLDAERQFRTGLEALLDGFGIR